MTKEAFARPRVVFSRCLGFAPCRWNGDTIHDQFAEALKPHVEAVAVCAELEMGLGAPRKPVRLVEEGDQVRLIQHETDRDCTGEMDAFCREFLAGLGPVDGFLFKGRSPSCGPVDVKIYQGRAKGASSRRGRGLFAEACLTARPAAAYEHEGRVKNFAIREHFLTKLFTLAELRQVEALGRMGGLVRFHSRHKLLLLAYSQQAMRDLGRLVANPDHRPVAEVMADYTDGLARALARSPRYTSNINVLQHGLGHFKKELAKAEKAYFDQLIQDYRQGKAPLSALQAVLRSWIERFDNHYLREQSFFAPYPRELYEISDSGKGLDR